MRRRTRTIAAGVAIASAALVGTASCAADDVEEERRRAFDGPYDAELAQAIDEYVGVDVSLTGDVGTVVSENAFTLIGPDQVASDALLVVTEDPTSTLRPSEPVTVEGTVQDDLAVDEAQEDIGVPLDEAVLAPYEGEAYLVASTVQAERADAA